MGFLRSRRSARDPATTFSRSRVDIGESDVIEFLDCREVLDGGEPEVRPTLTDRWHAFLVWRDEHLAQRALAHDLESYRSSAEIHELSAVVSRYEDGDVAEIGRLLQDRAHSPAPRRSAPGW